MNEAQAAAIRGAWAAYASDTAGLQAIVQHAQCVGEDETGAPVFDQPVPRLAFVIEGADFFTKPDGSVVATRAKIGFPGPIPPHGAPRRQEPIDPRDLFTLPSGLCGHIENMPGVLVDPLTRSGYVRNVWLV